MDEQAKFGLNSIWERYHDRVVAYAAKLLGRDDAEDVAQEVFLKVDRALPTLQDRSRLTSWIFAIAANTVRDVARERASRAARHAAPARADAGDGDPLAVLPDRAARSSEETLVLVRNEMVACYLDYVERLPANYHHVYVLKEFEELAIPEIARRLEISIGAAKIRLHRAQARLFAELRSHCRCYVNERGELMAEPKPSSREQGR